MKLKHQKLDGICEFHTPVDLPYLAWHDWSDRQLSRGRKQKRCPVCKRLFFPSEYGNDNPNSPERLLAEAGKDMEEQGKAHAKGITTGKFKRY